MADFVANDVEFSFYSDEIAAEIFPNPVKRGNDLEILISGKENNNEIIYCITDIAGRTISDGYIKGTTGGINTSEFNSGIYFINISSGNGFVTKKFVVE